MGSTNVANRYSTSASSVKKAAVTADEPGRYTASTTQDDEFERHKSYIMNRQIGVADSKYVVLDDSLRPGHVTSFLELEMFHLT